MKPDNMQNSIRYRLAALIIATVALMASSVSAQIVTGGFTGWWAQPDQQNHGLIITISRLPSGERTGVIFWAHFDEMGNPSWLFAQGDLDSDSIDATVFAVEGVTFMQPSEEGSNFGEQVGTMEVLFEDCLTGQVIFNTSTVGSGEFAIERLTRQPGAVCSGGIGDDREPGTGTEEFDIDLISTGVHIGAEGEAEFEIRPGKAEFEVEIENLPTGEYDLQIGEISRGTIAVIEDDDGDTEGEIEFRSPQTANTFLLDFDPRGQIIDVLDNGVIVLTGIAPDNGVTPGEENAPPFGDSEIEVDFNNDGLYPLGEAEAELEQGSDEVEFKIEIENIPEGSYTVLVDGIERGQIVVTADNEGTEGELEFRFPQETGTLLLDFDPRGLLVEILEDGVSIFHVDFPVIETDDDDDDDDNDDDDDDDD